MFSKIPIHAILNLLSYQFILHFAPFERGFLNKKMSFESMWMSILVDARIFIVHNGLKTLY